MLSEIAFLDKIVNFYENQISIKTRFFLKNTPVCRLQRKVRWAFGLTSVGTT